VGAAGAAFAGTVLAIAARLGIVFASADAVTAAAGLPASLPAPLKFRTAASAVRLAKIRAPAIAQHGEISRLQRIVERQHVQRL